MKVMAKSGVDQQNIDKADAKVSGFLLWEGLSQAGQSAS